MPSNQSQGKIDLLRLLGAEVYPVPAGESVLLHPRSIFTTTQPQHH